MATYTDNYQLTKPTYAEQADIGVINSNMNIIDEVMHSSQISLADAYDSTKSYAEGDKVMYELLMYKCISPTTGVWDGSKWERTTASESGGGGSAELDILGEASGAVASYADGASAGLVKCIVEIVPKQAGSGTPSPDNVRTISGSTSVTVTISDGETSTTKTTALGQTVYGGQLNVLTGELTVERVSVDMGSLTWTYESETNCMVTPTLSGLKLPISDDVAVDAITAVAKVIPASHRVSVSGVRAYVFAGNRQMLFRDTGYTDPSAFKTAMNGNNIVYALATPQTVQLTPQEVNSLLGQNNISADTGDIDIVYVKASAPIQPNPTGTPTATLKKLGIEGAVFEVPSGGGGSSVINYSTTEQAIGTWIDGKPVYEMTLTGNISATIAIPSLINIIEMKGGVTDNNGLYFVPISWNSGNARVICHQSNDGELSMTNTTDRTLYRITIRYTKITD